MKRLSAIALATWAGLTLAQPLPNSLPGLPPDDMVRQALQSHPDTLAAASEVRQETANRDRLEAGEYEWNLSIGGHQRRTKPPGRANENFNEWNVALERPLRLPGKAATDAEIGAGGIARAETAYGDAVHETKRDLLKSWFAWLKESATASQWAAQAELIERQARMIGRRLQLGDAARRESVQAEAALAQAQAQAIQAAARQQAARETLRRRYPALALGEPADIGEPPMPTGSDEEWLAAVAEHSHELALARRQTRLAELAATRQRQERMPDPSIGLAFSNERGGEEQVVGAFIRIPLAGGARRAAEQGAQAAADAARYREAALTRQIALATATAVHSARSAHAAWQASRTAAAQLQQAANMEARAYQLGEGSLNEWLTALRLANEAQLASRSNQLEALEQVYRLQLDADQIWQFGDE
ncbi:TolC family protein [Azonexus sp.]|jgi:outer membrane protein TolC|uniref:TolC family protein n=1 Tax=Azonexus sp. TaxID=1872668 RepID=UPI002825EEEA|nr:TolC family protein [Azonexus sp.]MDR1994281.1 TolC family protein [Azonexus sp.]